MNKNSKGTKDKKNNDARRFTHLTQSDRCVIEGMIKEGKSKTEMAEKLKKDKTTIAKEIKKHRKELTTTLPRQCAIYKTCEKMKKGQCRANCSDFVPFRCKRRDRTTGACDGCENYQHCRFTKYTYKAESAQKKYEYTRRDSREGVNLTYDEAKRLADIIRPALKRGLSLYQILVQHPEIKQTQSTLYRYIENGVFAEMRLTATDLRRQVSRRASKKLASKYKKRGDYRYLQGRKYDDYTAYLQEHPNAFTTQMDTVYNLDEEPYIQTFLLLPANIFLAVYRTGRKTEDMIGGVDYLEDLLGKELFEKYCGVILTDRGSEFTAASSFEFRQDGSRRSHVFYCDPMASWEKPNCEGVHRLLRYIAPKGTNLRKLGLKSQEDLDKIVRQIDSYPLPKMNGKTPFETAQFLYPDLYERLIEKGLSPVDPDDLLLDPKLLK